MKPWLPLIPLSTLIFQGAFAAGTLVNWMNNSGTEVRDRNGNLLSAGTSSAGDGTLLQLGYYSTASELNPFSGEWIPMTGPGSGSTLYSSVGDKIQGAGRFNISNLFVDGDASPILSIPLTIRFYDSTSVATSRYFNAVSNTSGLWNWKLFTPSSSTLNISLAGSGNVWLDDAGSAFRTTIAIPEPSASALLLLTGGSILLRRMRL